MVDTITNSLIEHNLLFNQMTALVPDIEKAVHLIVDTLLAGCKVLVCGNGGSAADAQHFAAEFVGKFELDKRRGWPVIALNGNSSSLTAIGNDYGQASVFSRQVLAYGSAGDVLVAITTGGQSRNVLMAIDQAMVMGMRVIVLYGEKGLAQGRKVYCPIQVPHARTARIQEAHEFILHCIAECAELELQ